jgi:transketolase
LTVIVDKNGLQAMGATENVMKMPNLRGIFEGFGLSVSEIDGHSERELDEAISKHSNSDERRPHVIIAKTVKGKGVSFMEGNNVWHYTRLTDESYGRAQSELGEGE